MLANIDGFPMKWDITIYQGSVWEYVFAVTYTDESNNAVLLDTEDWTAELTIKSNWGDPVSVASYTTENGRLLTGIQPDPNGDVNLWARLPATDTEQLPAGFVGVYNFILTPPSGPSDAMRFSHGSCCVDPEVKA